VHEQPLGELQARVDLVGRDRVADRLELELGAVALAVVGALTGDLDVERDGLRLLELVRRGEDAPRPAGLAAREGGERFTLRIVGALVVEGAACGAMSGRAAQPHVRPRCRP
jgi:hypothetical protein